MGETKMTSVQMPPPTSLADRKPLTSVQQNVLSPVSVKPEKRAKMESIHQKLTGRSMQDAALPEVSTPERKIMRDGRLNALSAQVEEIKEIKGTTALNEGTKRPNKAPHDDVIDGKPPDAACGCTLL